MNNFKGIGRITKDIECRYNSNTQMAVARFSLAIDRGKDKGTDFIPCVAFGKTAENLEKYSGKGLRVAVDGRIQTGSYEKNGQKFYTTDVIADRIEFIDWKGKSDAERAANAPLADDQEGVPQGFAAIDEEIPF